MQQEFKPLIDRGRRGNAEPCVFSRARLTFTLKAGSMHSARQRCPGHKQVAHTPAGHYLRDGLPPPLLCPHRVARHRPPYFADTALLAQREREVAELRVQVLELREA